MPEGPSIVILREAAAKFRGKTVRGVTGNSKLDLSRMQGRRVVSVRSWGNHFLLEFRGFSLRVHLMLFGSWLVDAEKDAPPRMSLRFDNGTLNVYACSLKYIEEPLDEAYDWRTDVMSPAWDQARARAKLKRQPSTLACDARCSTRRSSRASATSSRTRCCSGSACIRPARSARCRRASAPL